jgi:hypothetical protein
MFAFLISDRRNKNGPRKGEVEKKKNAERNSIQHKIPISKERKEAWRCKAR